MAQVVIGDILPYTQLTATQGQTVFSTNWTVNFTTDVVVYYTPLGSAPNDVTQLLSPSLYTVALIGGSQQVQVTLNSGATNTGDIVTITRQTPADRENLYSNTNFTPDMLNQDFGILTLVDQQAQLVNELIAPRYNYSAKIVNVTDNILPLLGASQTWVKNQNNTAITTYDLPIDGVAPVGATYITMTNEISVLPNSFPVSSLATGLLVNVPGSTTLASTSIANVPNQTSVTNGTGATGTITIGLANNPIMPGTDGMGIPAGTTLQRVVPTSPNINFRFNTDTKLIEYYSNGQWVVLANQGSIIPGLQNQLAYFAAAGNQLSGLATANNGTLVTSNTGTPSILQGPGTTGAMLQSNASAAPAWSSFTWPTTVGAAGTIIRSDGTNKVNSTSTFADTYALNSLLYASSANQVVGLATATNSVLVTDGTTGIPSLSATLPSAVQTNITKLGTQSQALNMGGFKITNGATPTNSTDFATKSYVDNAFIGTAVVCASTTALTVTQSGAGIGATLTNAGTQAVLTLDGVSPNVGQNVLIKNQSTNTQNGVYTVSNVGSISTNWVLTRATIYDTPAQINDTGLIIVSGGGQQGSAWYNTTFMVTVDTTAITYSQFSFGVVTVPNGGTGATSFNAYGVVCGGTTTTGALQSVAPSSTTGWVLTSNGTSALPTFQAPAASGFTTINIQTLTSASGTYTPTANMKYCIVEVVGGGGSGGGTSSTGAGAVAVAGAGGAGEYARGTFSAATIGASQSYTRGAGGTAPTAGNNPGNAGGATSLGALISANGGSGGFGGNTTGTVTNGVALTVGGGGGSGGTGGQVRAGGGAGGFGVAAFQSGTGSTSAGGIGGTSFFGAGGVGGSNANGTAGSAYGSGGGGAATEASGSAHSGGAGANGVIIITEFI